MMGSAIGFDNQKEQVRERLPLEDVLREYNVHLIAAGRNFKALCPFHGEKTPSFHVNVERQFYHCFGCQETGDLFTFVQKMEGVDFVQALELLAERAGIELVRRRPASRSVADEVRTVDLYQALEFARDFYHRVLLESPVASAAREYLERRKIEPESWKTFYLGFSPADGRGFVSAAKRHGLAPKILEHAGLIRSRQDRDSHYDYFRGRLMFPISNAQRRTVGFGARTLGSDEPKYLNSPASRLFDKSRLLYGLEQARATIQKRQGLTLVEGYTDVIMAHQAGLTDVVATLGTALTSENAQQLSRFASRVTLVFDGDAAGSKAAVRSLELLVPHELELKVFSLPSGEDPCEAIAAGGGARFAARMTDGALDAFEFKWRASFEQASADGEGGSGANARGRALDECLTLLNKVPNQVTRQLLLRDFAERIGVDERTVAERFRRLVRMNAPRQTQAAAQRAVTNQPVDSQDSPQAGAHELAQVVLECLLAMPQNAVSMWDNVPKEILQGEAYAELVPAIEGQLADGGIDPDDLLRSVQSAPTQSVLIQILSRLDRDDTSPSVAAEVDYSERWDCVLKDIQRYTASREIEVLNRDIESARSSGDQQRLVELVQRRFQRLREQKKTASPR